MSHYEKGNRSRENKSIFCRYARPQNPHLRLSKLRFLGLRSAAIKREQRLLADYAERER